MQGSLGQPLAGNQGLCQQSEELGGLGRRTRSCACEKGGGGCRVEVLMHYNCPFCSTDALVFTCLPAASGGRDLAPRNFGWLFLASLYCRKNVASVSFIPFLSLLLSPFPTSTSSHKDIYSFFLNMQTHCINIVNYKFSG